MFKRTFSGIVMTLLLISILFSGAIKPLKATGTIYIRGDGSIEPTTADIVTADLITYYFIGNNYDEIVVERDNVVVNGAGYTLQGTGSGTGISFHAFNITIKNLRIRGFYHGISIYNLDPYYNNDNNNTISNNVILYNTIGINLQHSHNNTVSGNNITENDCGVRLGMGDDFPSSGNIITGNIITDNTDFGISFIYGSRNYIRGNHITYSDRAVYLNSGFRHSASNNTISENNITNNNYGAYLTSPHPSGLPGFHTEFNNVSENNVMNNNYGVYLYYSDNNTFYHNNFIGNTQQVYSHNSMGDWNNSYPSGGNYWSDYAGIDQLRGKDQDQDGSDGIGDTPYIIDENNTDYYPLMTARDWPIILRPCQLISATIEGANPETVDPAWVHDNPSGELISNIYENLIVFNGEETDSFIPHLATDWTIEAISETSPEGLTWHYRYFFRIRTGVQWHDPTYGTVAPEDVEFSFERVMVQDRVGGPAWMFYEPLLNTWGARGLGNGDLSDPANIWLVGRMIDHAVESNLTHVWFNLAFPGSYEPLFMQILCQPWSSIICKDWVLYHVIDALGRESAWNGTFGDYSDWVYHYQPMISPLDDPTPVMMGCGPFQFEKLDYVLQEWSANRFVNYWCGWPIDWPAMSSSQPAGFVDHVTVTWAYDWPTRERLFLAGNIDFCAVPRLYAPSIIGQDGIRQIWPLPTLGLDAMFFNFDIDPTTPYGPILPAGTFDESGIPSDFFGNPAWGTSVRKAFAYAFDYAKYLTAAYLGEGVQPATAIIPGLPYHDPSVTGYTYNPGLAVTNFMAVSGGTLWANGFTIVIVYNEGNIQREIAANVTKIGIEALNPKFHVKIVSVDWRTYMTVVNFELFPMFVSGWSADFHDPHDFAFPFYHSKGTFAQWQKYSNPAMDASIENGIRTPDGSAKQTIYTAIQTQAAADCPSVPLIQPIGRHFERDWVVGWYYNILHFGSHTSGFGSTAGESRGLYFANIWKWYYVEEALQMIAAQPYSGRIPVDVNYDGRINMRDIGAVAASFGASYGPPIHPRWNFRTDINCDRKTDMKDIGLVAKTFGKTSPVWYPPP